VAVLVVILALVLLTAVIIIVASPLRAARRDPRAGAGAEGGELQELEARREAKYREIRDAELDFQTGKLSREDYAAIDAALRSEALDILDRLEFRGAPGDGGNADGGNADGGEAGEEGPTPRGA
jgi:hypothetical protein